MKNIIEVPKELLERLIDSLPISMFIDRKRKKKTVIFGIECKERKIPFTWEEFVEESKKIGKVYKEDKFSISFYNNNGSGVFIFVREDMSIRFYRQDTFWFFLAQHRTPEQMFLFLRSALDE